MAEQKATVAFILFTEIVKLDQEPIWPISCELVSKANMAHHKAHPKANVAFRIYIYIYMHTSISIYYYSQPFMHQKNMPEPVEHKHYMKCSISTLNQAVATPIM